MSLYPSAVVILGNRYMLETVDCGVIRTQMSHSHYALPRGNEVINRLNLLVKLLVIKYFEL